MHLILFCLFAALAVFFITRLAVGGIDRIEAEGKIHDAVEKKKSKSFITPAVLGLAGKTGFIFSKIKNKQFVSAMKKLESNFKSAGGIYEKFNPYQFLSLCIFSMFAGMAFCAAFISSAVIALLLAAILFFYLPIIKLKEAVKKRKELIFKQLPDTADLLSITLEAGSDFFKAAERVSDILKGPLSDDFKSALAKISLGYDKKTALAEISSKTNLEQLSFFVRTINMALDSGAGMSDTLKRLALQLRNERASAAEKKAQEAPVKILIPLVLLIFPTMFIVIFGPIAINLMRTGGF
ncbi:MAG: type II secretion system F family protein [Endomicrobium sp.]|jgi:tight adherence protein C|nr:type II secretion system F family protein [Endomicrobium sp.]